VHLDTTMAFTPWADRTVPFPTYLLPQLVTLSDRVLLGSDFPNLPYPYADQLAGLVQLDLGPAWLRGVLYENAARLLRMS